MSDSNHILIVDDEESIRFSLSKYLADAGYRPHPVPDMNQARSKIDTEDFGVAIVDRLLANGANGIDMLKYLREKQPFCQAVLISGYPSFESAAEAINLKVFAYLAKPVRKEQILPTVVKALSQHQSMKAGSLREKMFSRLFDGSTDAIAVYDTGGSAIFINPEFTKLFGYSRHEAIGHAVPPVADEDSRHPAAEQGASINPGEPVRYSGRRVAKNGRQIPVMISVTDIEASAAFPAYTLAVYRPAASDDCEAERAEAASTQLVFDRYFRDIAHDFNNMITIMLGNSELCEMYLEDNDAAHACLKNIAEAGKRARQLTGKVLSDRVFAGADAEKTAL
ncbi:MAG: PAS domain S-box protein, partial [Thermodesulfobacteriota bacterium]